MWLNARNLSVKNSGKIAAEREGPFKITEKLSTVTYRLGLPESWKIHDVFHATLLYPYTETEENSPNFLRPPPELVDGEE